MVFRRRRALVCRQAVELMTDYLDGALSAPDRARLEAHLSECPHCTEYLAQIRDVITAAGTLRPEDLPADTVDGLITLYRAWQAGT